MPDREIAHTTKTTTEKPRGRIRIQLDTPPKQQRGVRDWPVFDREEWAWFWWWYVADRDFWADVFGFVSWVGFFAMLPGSIIAVSWRDLWV